MRSSGKLQLNMARLLVVMVAILLVVGFAPKAQAAGLSGSCGEDVSWSLNGGILTISGGGEMADYTELNYAPWYDARDTVNQVVVEDGITQIGSFAFFGLEKLRTAMLPDSVEQIGKFAFYGCEALETAYIGNSVQEIGASAFEQCRSLKTISLPSSLTTIRSAAFYRCESLLTITVPASVRTMEHRVFTYCSGLRSAVILANIGELPYWTFYGCYALSSVSLSSGITDIGTGAFDHCDSLTQTQYGGTGDKADSVQQQIQAAVPEMDSFKPGQSFVTLPEQQYTDTKQEEQNGTTVTVDRNLYQGPNSVVDTQATHTQQGTTVKVQAVIKNESGWQDAEEQLRTSVISITDVRDIEVHIYLRDGNTVKGADLARFAGKDMQLVIHTLQGATWHINCQELNASKLLDVYDLSYSLTPVQEPTKAQKEVLDDGEGYLLVFNGTVNFKTALELPLGNPRYIASLHYKEFAGGYTLKQKVVIDNKGSALFYLEDVEKKAECFICVNIVKAGENGASTLEGALVPNVDTGEYLPVEWIDHDYYISGIESSWGLTIGQLTFILVAALIIVVVVVGVVMYVISKKKLKSNAQNEKITQ